MTPAEIVEFERAVLATMQRTRARLEKEIEAQLAQVQLAGRNLLEHERGMAKAEELLA